MQKGKIFNDPVYGFITIPYSIVFDIIEHPYFQRLRRISQLGLTTLVYPGANHTRFHHALGAMHLTTQAIDVLRRKGVDISEEEAKATCIAVLLHDIGHGPFSHTLERILLPFSHEELSLMIMKELNIYFDGALDDAIEIFQDKYPKKFLYQLISGQLDMDRLDYLNRDSFYTGVSEGVIGYDRIIKMLDVVDDRLVVEEKGIYSIEKFLISRRLMYWQVYLHKTVLVAEQMLVKAMQRAILIYRENKNKIFFTTNVQSVIENKISNNFEKQYKAFLQLDDYDIFVCLKSWIDCPDYILSTLSNGVINRRLFKIEIKNTKFSSDYISNIRQRVANKFNISEKHAEELVWEVSESNRLYNDLKDEILILNKNNDVKPMSLETDYFMETKIITKNYLCYPKI
ncbi:MAG: HD domain-containing protein [Saprospiraceae bacterium]|nr:HD domain-containing protein [Saprospiraceae bacterium]